MDLQSNSYFTILNIVTFQKVKVEILTLIESSLFFSEKVNFKTWVLILCIPLGSRCCSFDLGEGPRLDLLLLHVSGMTCFRLSLGTS